MSGSQWTEKQEYRLTERFILSQSTLPHASYGLPLMQCSVRDGLSAGSWKSNVLTNIAHKMGTFEISETEDGKQYNTFKLKISASDSFPEDQE